MSKSELRHEMDDGVAFWGYEERGKLAFTKSMAFELFVRSRRNFFSDGIGRYRNGRLKRP